MGKKVQYDSWAYSKFQGHGFERVREYGMEYLGFTMLTSVSNIPPWFFPEVKTDFAVLKKEWRMEEVGVP